VPSYDDVRAVAPAVLRHRVVTNFQAEADGRSPGDIVEELLQLSRKWT
jgi:MoxR-like ATPase